MFQITFISSPFYYIVFYDIHSVILKWGKLVTSYLPKLGLWIITMLLHTTIFSKKVLKNYMTRKKFMLIICEMNNQEIKVHIYYNLKFGQQKVDLRQRRYIEKY